MASQEEFQTALHEFCKIISLQSAVALKVDAAYREIYKQINSYRGVGDDWSQEKEDDRWSYINSFQKVDEQYMANTSIFVFMLHAIEIYQNRKDEYVGQTALLFSPDSWHIKSIRHIIWLIKESDLAFKPDTKEFAAATKVEEVLNLVLQNRYLPHSVKKDGAVLKVEGYSTCSSGGSIKTDKIGVVIRCYGEGKQEQRIFEMTPDNVLPNFFEWNLYCSEAKGTSDIAVLMPNGKFAKFNYCFPEDEYTAIDTVLPKYTKKDAIQERCYQMREKGHGAQTKFTPEEMEFITNEVIPYLVQKRPPLVKAHQTEISQSC